MCSIGQVSLAGSRLCSHSWGTKEGPENAERRNRKIKDALSKVLSRKHVALVQTFLPPAKIHKHVGISGGGLYRADRHGSCRCSPSSPAVPSSYGIFVHGCAG